MIYNINKLSFVLKLLPWLLGKINTVLEDGEALFLIPPGIPHIVY